jgi:aldose 1-epimerase
MGKVAMDDSAFRTARLCDEEGRVEVEFVPEAGMLCRSLRHREQELLAQNAGLAAYAVRGKTMGIPLLYPWANRLADFDYSVAGRTVTVPHDPDRIALDGDGLPIHGVIGGRLRWELTNPPESDAQSLTARLRWSESQLPGPFEAFPFRHDLLYEARLEEGRLEVTIVVDACGEDVVPVAFGLHPYLSPPGVARERYMVELPPMRHLKLDAEQIPIGSEEDLAARRFELAKNELDDGFDHVAEPARFAVEGGTRRVELEFVEGYPCAQVYAPRTGQFICYEPMTAPTNALRSGSGLRVLEPGERYSATFVLRVVDLSARGE